MSSDAVRNPTISPVSAEERPDLVPAFAELSAPVWPTFLDDDQAIVDCWDALYSKELSRYQSAVVQVDADGERVLATSNSMMSVSIVPSMTGRTRSPALTSIGSS